MRRIWRTVWVLGLWAPFSYAQTADSTQALQLETAGQYAQAEQAWQSLTVSSPGSAEAWAHLGLVRALRSEYAQAVPAYRKALALQPNFPGLEIDLALALFKQNEFAAAIPALLAAKQETASDSRPNLLLGMSYYATAQYSEAIPYLRIAVGLYRQNSGLRLALAQSCLWTEQYSCVLDQYKEILQLDPNSAQADMLAGEAEDGMNNPDGAIAQFRAAEQASPTTPNVHFGLGYLLWKQQQLPQAEQEFKQELAIDPNHEQALAYLGDVELKNDENAAAEQDLRRALQQKDAVALAYLDMGILESAQNQDQKAEADLKHAIALAPNDVTAHWRLARLYQHMGRQADANAESAKVSQLHRSKDEKLANKIAAVSAPKP